MNALKQEELDNQQRSPDEGNVHRLSRKGVQLSTDYTQLETVDIVKYSFYILKDPITDRIRYVGITKKNIEKRFREHISQAKYYKIQSHKNFWIQKLLSQELLPKIELIEERVCSYSEAYKIEEAYIRSFTLQGYNLVNGTSVNFKPSKLLRDKKHMFKKVVCLDLDGNYIKEFNSVGEASKFAKVVLPHITNVLKGRKKSAGGYVFVYSGTYNKDKNYKYIPYLGENTPMKNPETIEKVRLSSIKSRGKKIIGINMITNKEYFFDCITDAAKFVNKSRKHSSNIRKACIGKRNYAYGYYWKFYNEDIVESESKDLVNDVELITPIENII